MRQMTNSTDGELLTENKDTSTINDRMMLERLQLCMKIMFCKLGITLLEDLCKKNPDGKRDYIYYLSIGYTRLKEYSTAMKYVHAFLEIEPNNKQVIALEEYVKKKMDLEDLKVGVAMAGCGALVVGGILAVGLAMAKKGKLPKT